MKSTDLFPSNYLRAADLNGKEPIVTIDRLEMTTIGEERKAVVYFVGKDKGVVLNKTNWNSIAEITGCDDSDDWSGHRIKLITAKVEFQGKRVPAIRIEYAPAAGVAPKAAPAPPIDAPTEDEIPFMWLLPLVLPATMAAHVAIRDYMAL
jgi:hypothetical protein